LNIQADGHSLDKERRKIKLGDISNVIRHWKSRNPERDMYRSRRHFSFQQAKFVYVAMRWQWIATGRTNLLCLECQFLKSHLLLAFFILDVAQRFGRDLSSISRNAAAVRRHIREDRVFARQYMEAKRYATSQA